VILRKFFELGQSVLSNVYFQALFISLFKNLNEDNANKHILSSEITYFKLELFSISYDRGDWYGHNYFFCVFCRKTALKMSKWVTVPLTVPEIKRQRVVPSDIVSVIFFNIMLFAVVWNTVLSPSTLNISVKPFHSSGVLRNSL